LKRLNAAPINLDKEEFKMRFAKVLALSLAACLALPVATLAADAYPAKPVQIVVPGSPGGDTDMWARIIAKNMSKYLGQQVIVVNVAGGGGSIGSAKVKDSAPDGYTVLLFHLGMLLHQVTGVTKYGISDFEMGPVAIIDDTNAFLVNAENKNLPDLAALAKAIREKPGTLRYAADPGGNVHMFGLMLDRLAGGKLNIVDVGSQGPKIAALLGNQIDATSMPLNTIRGFIDSKKFRAVAILSEKRDPGFPDVPTAREQGIDLVASKPYFFTFPKGTPESVVDTFCEAFSKASKDPEMEKSIKEYGVQSSSLKKDEARAYLNKMQEGYQKVYDGYLESQKKK
jgi:tripartite-type tricarboxylate transporter receptor subunit TctC